MSTARRKTKRPTLEERQPKRAGDSKTLAVSVYGPELAILEDALERHQEMNSRATYSSMIRWLLHQGLLDKMPPSY